KPYDEDPLFAYLWGRGYLTPRYHAGNVARMMDGLVAEFIGYSNARPNYVMLSEIPVRLGAHATSRRAAADELKAARGAIERQRMVALGIEPKERALAAARAELKTADNALEA
ncbi:MAG TPA: hypothetical protein PK264_13900, partial [Hyphomicrobiaceae bacterium]|nr:hypothetical protein [Hyphomicrobiaceae bacterium]